MSKRVFCRSSHIAAGLLTASLVLSVLDQPTYAASPEFARSEEEWAVLRDHILEYGEIEDLIKEYNATVQINEHDYNKKKDDPDADDIAEEYRDAAEEIRDTIVGDEDTLLTDAVAEAQANQLEQLADNNVMDLKVYRLLYDQTEKSLAMIAQNQMAAYHQSLLNLEVLRRNQSLLEEICKVTEAQYSVGMASYLDVVSAQKEVKTISVSIQELESSIKSLKQNLCVMLGWEYDDEPEIMQMPEVDLERIGNLDPERDYEAAVNKNYSLRINLRKLENAEGMYTKQTLERTIDDNKQKIGTALEQDYRAVLQAEIALREAESKLETEQTRLAVVTEMYRVGTASALTLKQQETSAFAQETAVACAEIQLFMAAEAYDWDVRGMASVQ